MRLCPPIVPALRGLAAAALLAAAVPALAQGADFRPVVTVNGAAITGHELDQRVRFLQVLGTQGDLVAQARAALVDDKLRLEAARRFGIGLTDQQVMAGMAEFAGRANLDVEQFLAAVGQAGVAPETFRDFVRAGLVWRELVQARFGPRAEVPRAMAERAQQLEAGRGLPPRVLISELVLAAEPGETPEAVLQRAAELGSGLSGETAFAAAAQRLSAAPTAAEGGRLDWRPVVDLPPAARAALGGLQPGQVSQPVVVTGGAALFLLRDLREAGALAPEGVHLEYARLAVADAAAAAAVADRAGRCGDLFAEAAPDDGRLVIATEAETRLDPGLRAALAPLDPGETAVIDRGGVPTLVMLCARRAGGPRDVPSLDALRGTLLNERLAAEAELWLADLRDAAIIRDR